MSATHQPPIVVVGAGIAGLSFACAYEQHRIESGQNWPKVIILEKRAAPIYQSEQDKKSYSYSLSLRSDCGGINALHKLNIFDRINERKCHQGSFLVAFCFFNRLVKLFEMGTGVRILRSSLWEELETRAQELNIEIEWNASVINISGKTITYSNNEGETKVITTSGIIGADGYKSIVRELIFPNDNLNYLETYIIGCHTTPKDNEIPKLLEEKHGSIIGPSSYSVFFSKEKDCYLVSFSSKTNKTEEELYEWLKDQETLKCEALRISKSFPNVFENWIREVDPNSFFSVICRDKLPSEPTKDIVLIGDASHPVSPFAGAGANLAMNDGVYLADYVAKAVENNLDMESTFKTFSTYSKVTSEHIINTQRNTIQILHENNRFILLGRTMLLLTISSIFNHPKKLLFGSFSLALLIGFPLYKFFSNKNHS